ncbi:hypothetical protein ACRE_000290 [Hapsidospora chrysogenum ATCC 11550]|uniref:Uncharacterized protein n=1 Tax=Hapsidospora chrysogenum (strain ATCC 11550 / CBS 779.69 / DSM 880 / IAM 14645 / JCM 23072 / IMI 49137) TaxID=857340 RepID=A0A086THY8_HAPC1|nr:hypothetical protein ACRE_000290 [Hapsidospora chrysogenum ATCC 11550]
MAGPRNERADFSDGRGGYLDRITDRCLEDILRILRMPPNTNAHAPDDLWLHEQKLAIDRLDRSVHRTSPSIRNALHRLYGGVALCDAHRALDRRLVCAVFEVVADECLMHSDVLRIWRTRLDFEPEVKKWLVVMDEIAKGVMHAANAPCELLVGSGARGADVVGRSRLMVSSGCQACLLAAIGGNLELALALEAGVRSRGGMQSMTDSKMGRIATVWITERLRDASHAAMDEVAKRLAEMVRAIATAREDIDETGREQLRRTTLQKLADAAPDGEGSSWWTSDVGSVEGSVEGFLGSGEPSSPVRFELDGSSAQRFELEGENAGDKPLSQDHQTSTSSSFSCAGVSSEYLDMDLVPEPLRVGGRPLRSPSSRPFSFEEGDDAAYMAREDTRRKQQIPSVLVSHYDGLTAGRPREQLKRPHSESIITMSGRGSQLQPTPTLASSSSSSSSSFSTRSSPQRPSSPPPLRRKKSYDSIRSFSQVVEAMILPDGSMIHTLHGGGKREEGVWRGLRGGR